MIIACCRMMAPQVFHSIILIINNFRYIATHGRLSYSPNTIISIALAVLQDRAGLSIPEALGKLSIGGPLPT